MSKNTEELRKNQMADASKERSLCIQEQTAIVEWPLPLVVSPLSSSSSPSLSTEQETNDTKGDDFMGSATALKALFTLPSNLGKSSECLAVHRVGGTLVFEDICSLNEIANTAIESYSRGSPNQHLLTDKTADTRSVVSDNTSLILGKGDAMPRLLQAMGDGSSGGVPDSILSNSSNWLPPAPQPSLHTYHWHFNDFRIIVGSDSEVYSSEGHPAVSLRTHELGKQWERCTAVDAYLDNIMANIPELALSLELKGFIHGYKLMDTASIPRVNTADTSSGPRLSLLDTPMFDTKDVEMNASMLMRFLQANCKEDGATYFLQRETREVERSTGGTTQPMDCVRLYDLTAMSSTPTKKWKWLLAMLSYRFANRLRQTSRENLDMRPASFHESVQVRERELLETCIGLLQELSDMGGNGHDMIRATAHTQIAESYLTAVQASPTPATATTRVQENQKYDPKSQNNTVYGQSPSKGTSLLTKDIVAGSPSKMNPASFSSFSLKKPLNTSTLFEKHGQEVMDIAPSSPAKKNHQLPMEYKGVKVSMGWPGLRREEEFSQVSISLLEKAQQHLSKGLKIMDKMIEKEEEQEEDDDDDDDDSQNSEGGDDSSNDIDSSVRSEARKLRLRKIDLSLVIASRQMLSWQASSCMSSLREAARHLVPLMPELKKGSDNSGIGGSGEEWRRNTKQRIRSKSKCAEDSQLVRLALAWFWEIGGKLARALAADRYKWVEKAGVHPGDIVIFLGELDDLLRGKPARSAPHVLHQVSFLDSFAWMFHRDLPILPLHSLGPPPSMAHCHTPTTASAYQRSNSGNSSRRKKKQNASSSGKGGVDSETKSLISNLSRDELKDAEEVDESGPSLKHPIPLFIACSLCAARALEAISGESGVSQTRESAIFSPSSTNSSTASNNTGSGNATAEADQLSVLRQQAGIADSTVRLLLTRLGDACNEVGKALLGTVPQTSKVTEESLEQERRLFAALVWFSRSLEQFRMIKDKSNSALLLCNIASSKKLVAGRLPLNGKHELWNPTSPLPEGMGIPPLSPPSHQKNAVPVMDLVESLLTEAIADCYSAMECLGDRQFDTMTWDLIASELGMAYLTLGVRRRQCLLKTSDSNSPASSTSSVGHVSSGAAMHVAEPLEKAAKIYEGLGDRHQLAAARYQAGTLWSRLWTRASEPKKARERLAQALAHYEAAHTFYLQGNAGRTLIMIDLDLFDLYTAVHAASGAAGNAECLLKALLCLLETQHAFRPALNITNKQTTTGTTPSSLLNKQGGGENKTKVATESSPTSSLSAKSDKEIEFDLSQDTRSSSELKELIRLSGLVGERLPKVLLLLAKTGSSSTNSPPLTTTSLPPNNTTKSSLSPTKLSSSDVLVKGYKSMYLSAIQFKWPSNSSEGIDKSTELMKEALHRIGHFLQVEMHEKLIALKQQARDQ